MLPNKPRSMHGTTAVSRRPEMTVADAVTFHLTRVPISATIALVEISLTEGRIPDAI